MYAGFLKLVNCTMLSALICYFAIKNNESQAHSYV